MRRLHRYHTHRILTPPRQQPPILGVPPGTWPMRLPRCDQINVAQAARFQFRRTDLSDKMKRPVETRQRRLDWPDPTTGGDQWSRLPGVYHTKIKARWRSAGHATPPLTTQVIEVGPAGARCAASRPGLVGWHDVRMFIHEAFRGKIKQDPCARFPVRMSLGVKRAPVARRPAVLKVRS